MSRNALHVRNPLLRLPAAQRIDDLPASSRKAVRDLLLDLRADAARMAQDAWKRNKGMTAAYWKAVSVYAGHAARLFR